MRLLHSADWHLGAPLGAYASLRSALEAVPFQVVQAAKEHDCDVILLAGDLFDSVCTPYSLCLVQKALALAGMPVFIAPGNHDPVAAGNPWEDSGWPENVHIFKGRQIESVALPRLDCRIYGAAFQGPESGSLLEGFCADANERYCIGLFHGDPTVARSPYNPVTKAQIADSALDYLALGHIHKQGLLRSGGTLCGWPGCPMGKGYDETGEKGVLLVELEDACTAEFVPLDTSRFYDLEATIENDPRDAVEAALADVPKAAFCRLTLTGEAEPFRVEDLQLSFAEYSNLQLRDQTSPPVSLWENAGEDSLEGLYFAMLRQAMENGAGETARLAAQISRQLLLGQEVKLP